MFLDLTDWRLNDAIQLFYHSNAAPYSTQPTTIWDNAEESSCGRRRQSTNVAEQTSPSLHQSIGQDEPLPVSVKEEEEDPYCDSDNGSEDELSSAYSASSGDEVEEPTTIRSHDTLSSMYQPPYSLMYSGTFEEAKAAASSRDRWLIVNLQSNKEFNSQLLNRDTWSNALVEEIIKDGFVFWQAYNDTVQGNKVCTFYNLLVSSSSSSSLPAILIIDPITGQKMKAWSGMVHPDVLLEALDPYMNRSPNESLYNRRRSPKKHLVDEPNQVPDTEEDGEEHKLLLECPPLPEEPKYIDKDIHLKVAIRLPDGRRLQRNFLRSEPVRLLWPFCCLHLQQFDARKRSPFHFRLVIPGAGSKCLNYEDDDNLTFEEAGVANTVITLLWN